MARIGAATGRPARRGGRVVACLRRHHLASAVRRSCTARHTADDEPVRRGGQRGEREKSVRSNVGRYVRTAVAAELRAQVGPEEPGALAHDVVEDEEPVHLGQEAQLLLAQREHVAVGGRKREEASARRACARRR